MNIPENLLYTASHEWVRLTGQLATVGITEHAQQELTDVVFVELPTTDTAVGAGDGIAVVESVKAASDIYAPLAGRVVEINLALEGDPGLVNRDPYGNGWLCKLDVGPAPDTAALLSPANYRDQLSAGDHGAA